jgi:hypothetical protein
MDESGVYAAVRVSGPVASEPAGIVMVADPELSVVADEAKLPLERITEPVGVPPLPETAMATESGCAVVMVEAVGVTVTVGVVGAAGWVEVEPDPPPHAAIAMQTAATGNRAKWRAISFIFIPLSRLRAAESVFFLLHGSSFSSSANCRGRPEAA